jgi:hypothetical protein
MSVPVNRRSQGKLEVCVKAHDLCCYTLQIISNEKTFPAQYQRILTDRIADAVIGIHAKVWAANNILVNSPEDYAERLGLQEQAALQCNVFLSLIEVAHRVYHLETKRVLYWAEKAVTTRNLIRAWRDSDRKRYQSRFGNDKGV